MDSSASSMLMRLSFLILEFALELQVRMRFTSFVLVCFALFAATCASAKKHHRQHVASYEQSDQPLDSQEYGQYDPRTARYPPKYARRQNWLKNTFNTVKNFAQKPGVQTAISLGLGAYRASKWLRGRRLKEQSQMSEQPESTDEVAPRPRRHRRRRGNQYGLNKRSARRQNWFKNAYNKVSPWAGPVIGAGMGAYNVYKNGKTLYGLATGRKLREMANTKTIQQVDDSPVVADGAARQLRGANYVE
ncbi:hypothetical protein AC1031_021605 [Aphanomyces cochlioides]|nr:hypothetical protein AC1031_021605 [Aphanomyces cochlioides]